MIPPPRNILVSYHYFQRYDLDKFAGLRVIGDSGAFSAHSQGVEITTPDLAAWAQKWRHRLCWVAALDVIGDPEATRRNWHEMVDGHGVPGVPTVHLGADPTALDYYADRGVDFVGLGGMVGRPPSVQLRWCIAMFKYARDHHPQMRFHGWGVTHQDLLKLPWFSVDSSGWGAGYRYGRLSLRHPKTGKSYGLKLDGQTVFDPDVARLLRDHYGVNPSEVATSGPHNRALMVRLSALSESVKEQQFRRLHRRAPVTAPEWGQLGAATNGPHEHLAMSRPDNGEQSQVNAITRLDQTGPHLHLAVADTYDEARELPGLGPHLHFATQPNHEARYMAGEEV